MHTPAPLAPVGWQVAPSAQVPRVSQRSSRQVPPTATGVTQSFPQTRTCPEPHAAALQAAGGLLLQPSAPVAPMIGTTKASSANLDRKVLLSFREFPIFFLTNHCVLFPLKRLVEYPIRILLQAKPFPSCESSRACSQVQDRRHEGLL